MKRTMFVVWAIFCAGLLALSCGDDGEGGDCAAGLHLEVCSEVCDFSADEVECYYESWQEEGGEWEAVGCFSESENCAVEFEVYLVDGEVSFGGIGLETEDVEAGGLVEFASFDYEKNEDLLSATFAGALADDSSIAVSGCFEDLPCTVDDEISCDVSGGDAFEGVCSLFWGGCSDGNDYEIECTINDAGEGTCTCDVNGETVQECETTDGCSGDVVCCTEFPDLPL